MDCSSCEELREIAPEFVQEGVTDFVAGNLANNTGYGGKSNNCNDLPLANDCLIGRMPTALAAYDDCNWKEWAADFSGNVYQMMASMIAAWCQLTGSLQTAPVKIIYTRDNGGTGASIPYWNMAVGDRHSVQMYINAREGVPGTVDEDGNVTIGSEEADRDYAVIVTHCVDMQNAVDQGYNITWYCDADVTDTMTLDKLMDRRGQHPGYRLEGGGVLDFAWPITETVYVKKGHHLCCDVYCRQLTEAQGQTPRVRIHQIATTWIPINSVEVNE